MKTELIDFNINYYIHVQLTDRGREIHKRRWNILMETYPGIDLEYRAPDEDKDGWSKWQAWDFMKNFGAYMGNGCKPVCSTGIKFELNL